MTTADRTPAHPISADRTSADPTATGRPRGEAVARAAGRPRSEAVDVAILDAAAEILANQGWPGLTIEAVAARAGVAKTSVYRRWSSTDEIAFEAINRLKGPIVQAPGGSVRDDLVYLGVIMRDHWYDTLHAKIMRQVIADGNESPAGYLAMRERLIAPRQRVTREVLARGVAEGLVRPDVDLEWVVGLLNAPIVLATLSHQPPVTDAQIEFTVDTVLQGVAPQMARLRP